MAEPMSKAAIRGLPSPNVSLPGLSTSKDDETQRWETSWTEWKHPEPHLHMSEASLARQHSGWAPEPEPKPDPTWVEKRMYGG